MSDFSDDAEESAAVSAKAPAAPALDRLLDRLGDPLQRIIAAIVGSNRKGPRRLKSLLNGTWLRHPLHPAIIDVPIGAWIVAAILDILWLSRPTLDVWAIRGAQAVVVVGLVAALGAYATGATDWSDTYGAERRTGLIHGLLMTLAIALYAISTGLRFLTPDGKSTAAAWFGFAGLVVVLTGAFFGGEMVFRFATGVNHTVMDPFVEQYEPAMALADLPENALRRVVVGGAPVLLLRLGERVSAIGAICTHAGGPLDEGELHGEVVQCPWHGSRFRLRDGRVLTGPATIAAPRYDVRVRAGQIEIKRSGSH
jgi:nitrite reductase/ring-hydroxylating ferredoxin subunit/uncharacterized membrane protein